MSIMSHKKYIKLEPGKYEVWSEFVLEYKEYNYPEDLDMVIKLIKDNLETKFVPTKFRENNLGNPMFGHCYHATQALYYFFAHANLKAMSAKCEGPAEVHWWLQDGDTIIDATAEQYDILDFNLPYPPLSEQQQIVEYLDEQTQLIDNTISIEEKRIELLKEYRQSLISEVVTGKLKVTTDE